MLGQEFFKMNITLVPLSDIQERVERAIYESIRIQLVAKGYLPDITLYPGIDNSSWRALQEQIVIDKGFCIDLLSWGGQEIKGAKNAPRIVLESQGFLPGEIGADGTIEYMPTNDGRYQPFIRPPQTSDYFFNVRFITEKAQQERVGHGIIQLALPKRRYVPLNDGTGHFLVVQLSNYIMDFDRPGQIEKLYYYTCPDLLDVSDTWLPEVISPLKETHLIIKTKANRAIP